MLLSPRWRKVFRDLWLHKSRTILVILSIAIGVFVSGGLITAGRLVVESVDNDFAKANPSNINMVIPEVDELLVQYVKRQPYVTDVQAYTSHSADLIVNGEVKSAKLIAYEDMRNIHIDRVNYEAGIFPPEQNEIIVERSFLDNLDAQIGDTITIRMPDDSTHQVRLVGTIHSLEVNPGTLSIPVWLTPRTLFNMGLSTTNNRLDMTIQGFDGSSVVGIPKLEAIANQLLDDLRDQGVPVLSMSVESKPEFWARDILEAVPLVLGLIGLVSLLLSGFLVINTISGIMAAQKKQIGIMKIIGASRSQIIVIYLVMVAILGTIAFIIGAPLSLLLADGLLQFFADYLNYNAPNSYLPTDIIVMEITVSILVPVVSALFPVLNGTAITPAAAITDYVAVSGTNIVDRVMAKLGGFYRPALVAIRNTFRKKTRLAITLSTLTIAGMVFISVVNVRSGLLANIDDMLHMAQFDIQMSLAQFYQMDAIERRVVSSPYIKEIESWTVRSVVRERPDGSESENYDLIGMYPDSIFVDPNMLQGQWLPEYNPRHPYYVVVPPDILAAESDLYVGATIRLKLGREEQDWTIIGEFDTNNQPSNDIYAYYDSAARFTDTLNLTNYVLMDVVDSISLDNFQIVADQLTDYLEDRNFTVASTFVTTDIKEMLTTGFNSLVVVLLGMAVLIAIVAGLGLTGTMSLNVLERTREIGVMRAVGAGSTIIRLIFVGEGVFIGIISFLGALPLSILGTFFFSSILGIALFGDPLTIVFTPLGVIVWLVIVLSVSSIASITPANRASQISIREAIAYE